MSKPKVMDARRDVGAPRIGVIVAADPADQYVPQILEGEAEVVRVVFRNAEGEFTAPIRPVLNVELVQMVMGALAEGTVEIAVLGLRKESRAAAPGSIVVAVDPPDSALAVLRSGTVQPVALTFRGDGRELQLPVREVLPEDVTRIANRYVRERRMQFILQERFAPVPGGTH